MNIDWFDHIGDFGLQKGESLICDQCGGKIRVGSLAHYAELYNETIIFCPECFAELRGGVDNV